MVKHVCQKCKSVFDKKSVYDIHLARRTDCRLDKKRTVAKHMCEHCDKVLSRKDSLVRHLKTCTVKIQNDNINIIKAKNIKANNNKNIKTKNIKTKSIKTKNINANNNKNANNKHNKNANNKNINNKNANNKNNKTINIKNKNSNNKNSNNKNTNITINNNIQLPIMVKQSHLNALSPDEEYAIFNSKDNPMMMMVALTHLAKDKPQYHNIGYNDNHSGAGHEFNGKKFVKKPITQVVRNVQECRLKDLEDLYNEIKEFFTDEVNKSIEDKLTDLNNMLLGKTQRDANKLRSLTKNIKNIMHSNRNLFQEVYKRVNTARGYNDNDDVPGINNGEPALGQVDKEMFNDVRINKKKIISLKQEMARELLNDMKDVIGEEELQSLVGMITEGKIDELNTIDRLLRKSYCFNKKITHGIVEKEIKNQAKNEELLDEFLQ